MQISENKTLFFAFLVTLALHLAMVNPASRWLMRNLVPQFTGEHLEIDINEIQSNSPPLKQQAEKTEREEEPEEKREKPIPPTPKTRKLKPQLQTKSLNIPEQPERSAPSEKKQLSAAVKSDPEPLPPEQTVAGKPVKPVSTDKPPDRGELNKPEEKADATPEPIQSPLFLKKKEQKFPDSDPLPEEIRKSLREGTPEKTIAENLQYSMNNYQWRFDRFIDNWVIDIQRWWKAPIDYLTGKMPEGGDLWVQVHLAPSGRLLSYRILRSDVTPEMELRAIQALIGSLKRPELPPTFVEEKLVINWRFIYPPLRPQLRMRR